MDLLVFVAGLVDLPSDATSSAAAWICGSFQAGLLLA